MPFEVSALYIFVLLFVTAFGAKTVTLDIGAGGLERYQSPTPLKLTEDDLETTIRVNCTNTAGTYSMFYVSKEMYDDCTVPVAPGTNGHPPLNRIQCSESFEKTLVDYSVTIRPPGIPNVVSFMLGRTYYFAFYEGDSIGSLSNAPCLAGLKFAIHIHDPSTVTTPTPTSTIASSTLTSIVSTTLIDTIYTTRVASTSATQEPKASTSRDHTSTTAFRTLGVSTRTVPIPTQVPDLSFVNTDQPISETSVEGLTSGASPAVWTSLMLPLLLAAMTVVVNYYWC